MKCQILFSGKNKKNIINLPSAENAQRVVKVNKMSERISEERTPVNTFCFLRTQVVTFHSYLIQNIFL